MPLLLEVPRLPLTAELGPEDFHEALPRLRRCPLRVYDLGIWGLSNSIARGFIVPASTTARPEESLRWPLCAELGNI